MSKSNKNKGLGKGLSALLGDSAVVESLAAPRAQETDGVKTPASGEVMVAIEHIIPGPWQPRRDFDEKSLAELADSIAEHGVVQPLLVREGDSGQYELIAGERRWRAAQRAGLHKLPVLIRDADDNTATAIALIENIQRHNLNAIEEAAGYKDLMDKFDYTQAKLAKIVGKSRSHLANMMRLLELPDEVQAMLRDGRVTAGQMRPLIGHEDALSLARDIVKKGMSARQIETMLAQGRKQPQGDKSKTPPDAPSPDIKALEKELREQLGLDVALAFNETSQNGKITIKCRSLAQFDDIIERFK